MSQISYHRNPNCAQFPLLRLIKYVLQRQRYRCNTIIMNSSERKVKKNVLVAPSCPTLCHPTDCGLPAPSVFGILQARILEQVTIFFSNNLKKQNKTKQNTKTLGLRAIEEARGTLVMKVRDVLSPKKSQQEISQGFC